MLVIKKLNCLVITILGTEGTKLSAVQTAKHRQARP